MGNAQSTSQLKTMVLDSAGGYGGPFSIKSILLHPTATAGTFTFRSTNSASGPVLLEAMNAVAGGGEVQIVLDGVQVAGIYMNTGFPEGGKAVILCD